MTRARVRQWIARRLLALAVCDCVRQGKLGVIAAEEVQEREHAADTNVSALSRAIRLHNHCNAHVGNPLAGGSARVQSFRNRLTTR